MVISVSGAAASRASFSIRAVTLSEIGTLGFVSMMIFLAILVVGFVYEWSRGALDWE